VLLGAVSNSLYQEGAQDTLKLVHYAEAVDQPFMPKGELADAIIGGDYPTALALSNACPGGAQLARDRSHIQQEHVCVHFGTPQLTQRIGMPLLAVPAFPQLCQPSHCIVPTETSSDCRGCYGAHQPAFDSLLGSGSCLHVSACWPAGNGAGVDDTVDLQLEFEQDARVAQQVAQPTWWASQLPACEQLHDLDICCSNGCCSMSPQIYCKL